MSRPPRVVLVGVGAMGALLTRLLVERGAEIVGAVARSPEKVGRDLGELTGLGRSLGVVVDDDLGRVVAAARPDVALVAAASLLRVMAPTYRLLLAHGVDVITLEEETVYPWSTEPELAAELDGIAKQGDATLIASGTQDVFWINLVATLTGAAHRIDVVRGYASWDAGDYGPEVARTLRIGDTPEQFERHIAEEGWTDFIVRHTVEALVAKLGLEPVSTVEDTVPVLAEQDIPCPSLDVVVPAGRVIGVTHGVSIETAEGTLVTFDMAGKLYGRGEQDVNEWVLRGEPEELRLRNVGLDTRFVTCSTMVNRIPDVLAAPAGLLSLDRMPALRYRHVAASAGVPAEAAR